MSEQNKLATIIDNNWEVVKSEMRYVWEKLTDKDVSEINNYNDLVKKLCGIYKFSEEEINTRIGTFIENLNLQPNLTYMQELKETLYKNTVSAKDKITKKLNINSLQKNAAEMQSAVTGYVKQNPLKVIGLGILAAVVAKKIVAHKTK